MQIDLDASATALAFDVARLAAVMAGDASYKGQAKADALTGLRGASRAIEGLEDALALGRRHTRPLVLYAHAHAVGDCLDVYVDLAAGRVASRVLEEVAQQTSQQACIAMYAAAFAANMCADACRFLCSEREQFHVGGWSVARIGVHARGGEQFVNQFVEFSDIAPRTLGHVFARRTLQQFDRHRKARQRRAQLVRGGGQRVALCAHQAFDARRSGIETRCQLGDFILAVDIDTRRQVALAERLDALLQALEAARDAS